MNEKEDATKVLQGDSAEKLRTGVREQLELTRLRAEMVVAEFFGTDNPNVEAKDWNALLEELPEGSPFKVGNACAILLVDAKIQKACSRDQQQMLVGALFFQLGRRAGLLEVETAFIRKDMSDVLQHEKDLAEWRSTGGKGRKILSEAEDKRALELIEENIELGIKKTPACRLAAEDLTAECGKRVSKYVLLRLYNASQSNDLG